MTGVDRGLVGRTLGGRFRLTGFLGEGAMASVYRGEQDGDPREVAVKVMHTELLADPTFAKRFTREAKAAARIVHKNSVRIVEHGVDGDHLYLAMELLSGQDLFDLLARERRLAPARAADVVEQVAAALATAHAQGIVHRDLKPENVMVLPDPERPGADLVKVLDFGIAKILEREHGPDDAPPSQASDDAPPSSVLTRVGGIVGTPEYMAPEQALGQDVDARSDVYSCGTLLFHAVTGRQPFTAKHPLEVILMVSEQPPPAPSSILPSVPPELERIILKALSKRPEERQQSASELGAELRAFLAGAAPAQAAPSGNPSTPPVSTLPAPLSGVPAKVTISAPPPPLATPGGDSDRPPPMTLRSPSVPHEEVVTTETSGEAAPRRREEEPAATRRGEDRAMARARRRATIPTWAVVLAVVVVVGVVGIARWLL